MLKINKSKLKHDPREMLERKNTDIPNISQIKRRKLNLALDMHTYPYSIPSKLTKLKTLDDISQGKMNLRNL